MVAVDPRAQTKLTALMVAERSENWLRPPASLDGLLKCTHNHMLGNQLSWGLGMRYCVVLLLAVGSIGCSSSECGVTDPRACDANRAMANNMTGGWLQLYAARGATLRFKLAAHDTTLIGTGTYTTDAGPTGSVDVRGFVFWRDSFFAPSGHEIPAEPIIVLDFTFDSGRTARFDQGVILRDTLVGGLTFAEAPTGTYGVSFARTP
jgi:hypothetical protein